MSWGEAFHQVSDHRLDRAVGRHGVRNVPPFAERVGIVQRLVALVDRVCQQFSSELCLSTMARPSTIRC